jgi:signal transduction histidine kinase
LQRLYEEVRGFATPIQLDLETGEIESVVLQTWTHLQRHAESAAVTLHHGVSDIDTKAVFDRHRIGQVVRNIFENAIEAASEGGTVDVSYAAAQLHGKPAVEVQIRDSGAGLAASQAEHVFEPFFTTKTKGTGLGMAIAKRIVEMHGGQIALANPGQPGARFVVTLPREP